MPNPKQLPSLLKLLDDDSPFVRKAVMRELSAFGSDLEREIEQLDQPLEPPARRALDFLLAEQRRVALRRAWPGWQLLEGDKERLEAAHSLLADFQGPRGQEQQLGALLDELASEYLHAHRSPSIDSLVHFLFVEKDLHGARTDYYSPRHSNLVAVLEDGRGLPISLACILMLVGHRTGLDIQGCNFPGHFLARVQDGDRMVLIDCFNRGKTIDPLMLLAANPQAKSELTEIFSYAPPAELIIARVLRNLVRAYESVDDPANRDLMHSLLKQMVD
jgi:hypothetical protein